ncbi:MAG: MFS transporter [Bacteroides sp.]|nr:MFS transporter [Bacteroides sp.]
MRKILRENDGLPLPVLVMLAVIAGMTVANLYYSQPLLNLIRHEFGVTEFTANFISMITQAGYAVGLLFIVPLGDMLRRRNIILSNFGILILALLGMALAPNIYYVWMASLLTGICSVMPQMFVPIASQISTPETKGRNIGFIISGLLTGILASRVVSGMVGDYFGWRTMYLIAAGLMLLCAIVIVLFLPDIRPTFQGTYRQLMGSIGRLVREEPRLRLSSLRAALAFGSFLAFWSTLAFKMELAPFYAGSHVIGLMGLCGIAGALSASFIGKYVRKIGVRPLNYLGCALHLAAWWLFWFSGNTYRGIIFGIIVIDIGMQCIQLGNQTSVFELRPGASNRINTVFMTTYFVGGALGTLLAGTAWQAWGWSGVVMVGVSLTLCSLLINVSDRRYE